MVGVDQGGDHRIDGTAVEQRHGIERAFGLDPADLRIVPRQHGVHGAVAGNGDAMPLQLFQRGEGLFVLAADQHIGAFQVGLADLQVVFVHPAGGQCSDDIGTAILEAGNHVGKATGALHFETQAGAQAKELEQVGGDAAKMPRAIEIGDRCSGVIDCHAHHRVVFQPLFFGVGQLQLAVCQQQVATGAPALEDTGAYGRGLSVQGGVHHLHQHPVLVAQGKTEADGFVLAETGHAQTRQVAAIELVVGGNGIADEHVGLAERHGTQGLAGRAEGQQLGLGVGAFHLLPGQVVVEHAQAHASQAHVQRPAFVLARYQHRLVDGIGVRQGQAIAGRFVAIGAAKQVDVTLPERLHRRLPAGKTQHSHGQLQGLADQARVLGGKALVVAAPTGDVERRVVWCRGTQHQFLTAFEPLPLFAGEGRQCRPGR